MCFYKCTGFRVDLLSQHCLEMIPIGGMSRGLLFVPALYRCSSLTRHCPPPQDNHRGLAIGLLKSPRGELFVMSEVPLYREHQLLPENLQIPGFGFRVSVFGFRISGVGCRVSGFGFRVSSFGFQVEGFEYRVSVGSGVSGFGFWVSGFGFRVSDFGF